MKRLLLVMLASAIVASCGSDDPSPAALPDNIGPVSANTEILVDDSFFAPAELVVIEGSTVTWSWHGRAVHDVAGPGFASSVHANGEFQYVFDEIGTYAYRCTLHPGMDGTVFVVPAS